MDPGKPAPYNGRYYSYWANWDAEDHCWHIILDTEDAKPSWGEYGEGCQRVGRFEIYPGTCELTLTKKSDGSCDTTGMYSLAGAEYGLFYYYADAESLNFDNGPAYTATTDENGKATF